MTYLESIALLENEIEQNYLLLNKLDNICSTKVTMDEDWIEANKAMSKIEKLLPGIEQSLKILRLNYESKKTIGDE